MEIKQSSSVSCSSEADLETLSVNSDLMGTETDWKVPGSAGGSSSRLLVFALWQKDVWTSSLHWESWVFIFIGSVRKKIHVVLFHQIRQNKFDFSQPEFSLFIIYYYLTLSESSVLIVLQSIFKKKIILFCHFFFVKDHNKNKNLSKRSSSPSCRLFFLKVKLKFIPRL